MSRLRNCTNENDVQDTDTIGSLIVALGNKDGLERQHARRHLVAIGRSAMAPLMKALTDSADQVRWEAAKALGEIGDPSAAQALVSALEDRDSGVRWLAAQGLIALGYDGLTPLLWALVEHSDSVWLREGAHHVFHSLAGGRLGDKLAPVLTALDDIEPALEVPVAARAVLEALTEARRRDAI